MRLLDSNGDVTHTFPIEMCLRRKLDSVHLVRIPSGVEIDLREGKVVEVEADWDRRIDQVGIRPKYREWNNVPNDFDRCLSIPHNTFCLLSLTPIFHSPLSLGPCSLIRLSNRLTSNCPVRLPPMKQWRLSVFVEKLSSNAKKFGWTLVFKAVMLEGNILARAQSVQER